MKRSRIGKSGARSLVEDSEHPAGWRVRCSAAAARVRNEHVSCGERFGSSAPMSKPGLRKLNYDG